MLGFRLIEYNSSSVLWNSFIFARFQFFAATMSTLLGAAMATPIAANYANLFMDMFETTLLNDFHKKTGKKPLIWLRFIDVIFFISTDGEDSLKE